MGGLFPRIGEYSRADDCRSFVHDLIEPVSEIRLEAAIGEYAPGGAIAGLSNHGAQTANIGCPSRFVDHSIAMLIEELLICPECRECVAEIPIAVCRIQGGIRFAATAKDFRRLLATCNPKRDVLGKRRALVVDRRSLVACVLAQLKRQKYE